MSCEKCEGNQEYSGGYYYRFENANIFMGCCEEHFIKIRDILNEVQKKQLKKEAKNED